MCEKEQIHSGKLIYCDKSEPERWPPDEASSNPGSVENIRFRDVFARLEELQPLPRALQKLFQVMQDENACAADLEEIIQHDEVMASKILQLANSAYYGAHGNITTLSRAIMTMGFHETASISLCYLLTNRFYQRGGPGAAYREEMWKHSHVTARMAGEIVQTRPWMKKEEAYVLGLLHNLGLLVMLVTFYEHFRNILEITREKNITFREAETEYGLTHTQIGKWVATRWKLPEIYRIVMTFHHDPWDSPLFQSPVKVIFLADAIARSRREPELLDAETTRLLCNELLISEEEWRRRIDSAGPVFEEAGRLWECLA